VQTVYYGDQVLLAFYGNDIWKVRPNLTLSLGLRYEYQTVPYSERLQTVNSLASVPGLISFTEPKPQTTNVMPRLGVAYSPGTSAERRFARGSASITTCSTTTSARSACRRSFRRTRT